MTSLFIATPISAFKSNNEYMRFRDWVIDLIEAISEKHFFNEIFCVANKVKTQDSLNDPIDSLVNDISALQRSTHFLFIYPVETPTSALIELGYALGMNKIITLVHSSNVSLPFMAKKMNKVYNNIEKIEVDDFNDLAIHLILGKLSNKVT